MTCPFCLAANEETADTCFKCGKALFALTEGAVLAGRYEIRRCLGRGGMGIVYQAFDRQLEETVAVKVLRSDLVSAPDMARRFRTEIKLARRVRHPNVCAIHEYGQQDHIQYIVMEYIEGVDLKRHIRERGMLPTGEAHEVAIQLARGLHAIHQVGIVHRDLKSPNIMRDALGVVRLMDFGIAKQLDLETAAGVTATGHIVGTPEYMSPEQARGQKVDVRTDIYAAGIVIYELFTGRVPFRADTPLAVLMMHLHDPPPLDEASLPPDIVPVLRKCLAKDRNDRYPSSHDVVEALRQARIASGVPAPIRTRGGALAEALADEDSYATPLPTPVPTPVPTPRPTAVPARLSTWVPTRVETGVHAGVAPAPPPPLPRWVVAAGVAGVIGAVALAVAAAIWGVRPLAGSLAVSSVSSEASSGTRSQGVTPPLPKAPPETAPTTAPAVQAAEPVRASVSRRPDSAAAGPRSPVRSIPSAAPAAPPAPVAPSVAVPAAPTSAASAAAIGDTGTLRLLVVPSAEVFIDGTPLGTMTLRTIPILAGTHVIRLRHADFEPLERTVEVKAGAVTRLTIDLGQQAVRKGR
jgi:serine/threonine-protein kinase